MKPTKWNVLSRHINNYYVCSRSCLCKCFVVAFRHDPCKEYLKNLSNAPHDPYLNLEDMYFRENTEYLQSMFKQNVAE